MNPQFAKKRLSTSKLVCKPAAVHFEGKRGCKYALHIKITESSYEQTRTVNTLLGVFFLFAFRSLNTGLLKVYWSKHVETNDRVFISVQM